MQGGKEKKPILDIHRRVHKEDRKTHCSACDTEDTNGTIIRIGTNVGRLESTTTMLLCEKCLRSLFNQITMRLRDIKRGP